MRSLLSARSSHQVETCTGTFGLVGAVLKEVPMKCTVHATKKKQQEEAENLRNNERRGSVGEAESVGVTCYSRVNE